MRELNEDTSDTDATAILTYADSVNNNGKGAVEMLADQLYAGSIAERAHVMEIANDAILTFQKNHILEDTKFKIGQRWASKGEL